MKKLRTTGSLVEVDVDALELEVGVTVVGTGGVNTVLIANNLPGRRKGTGEEVVQKALDCDGFKGGSFAVMEWIICLHSENEDS